MPPEVGKPTEAESKSDPSVRRAQDAEPKGFSSHPESRAAETAEPQIRGQIPIRLWCGRLGCTGRFHSQPAELPNLALPASRGSAYPAPSLGSEYRIMATMKTWAGRIAVAAVGLGVVGGGAGVLLRETLSAKLAVHRFHSRTEQAERTAQAFALLMLGEAGVPKFVTLWEEADEGRAELLSAAWTEWAATAASPELSARLTEAMLGRWSQFAEAGKTKLLDHVETLLTSPRADAAESVRALVKFGFTSTPDAKSAAVRWASHSKVQLRKEAAGLLHDPSPRVRLHVMMTVAQMTDDQAAVLSPEELFSSLHDVDAGVREWSTTALRTHGLTLAQISLARQFTHPDPAERLLLLNDMADGDLVKDPGPWLERLSRDVDPAVRLGAARTASELNVKSAAWMEQLAASDPDPLVRQWSAYYRNRIETLRTVGR